MSLLGLAAWAGGLLAPVVPDPVASAVAPELGAAGPVPLVLAGCLGLGVVGLVAWGRRRAGRDATALATALGATIVLLAVAWVGVLRAEHVASDPVAALAGERAQVTAEVSVASDPRVRPGRFGDQAFFRARVERVHGRGVTHDVHVPVLVVAGPDWATARLGSGLVVRGRLAPAEDGDLAAVLAVQGSPVVTSEPDLWWRGAEAVRASLAASVAGRPDDQRALVPALVVGDDASMDPGLVDDMRATGLTHLTAVSGTNLTLLVGFLLVVARWAGARGRWLLVVAALGIVGFLLLARAEPSVLRAAAMGSVALLGLGTNGLRRGTRALGVAVLVLLLLDPWLAGDAGFALSVLATAGILLLAPSWRDALGRWLPRPMAEAVAIPAAAQLVCTPVVAAISGQVSLVAVAANLAVAPVVGPATVLGLAGALVGLVWAPAGAVLGTGASWCVAWIVLVAEQGARLPGAATEWSATPTGLVALTAVCLVLAWLAPRLLAHPVTGLGCCLLLVVVVVGPPSPGWPPEGWVFAACDVGQGDALVLNAGGKDAVIVDAGPEPSAVDACLTRLDVERVPLVVLTHFHADHVDGLRGVLQGRSVGELMVTSLADPAEGAADVTRVAAADAVPVGVPPYGATRSVGSVTLQVLWPPADPSRLPTEGSAANNASLVLLVRIGTTTLLLTGDVEPEAQAALARSLPGLRVDVLKVPHHGSPHQDLAWLTGLRPRLAVVSVGTGNDYGHPAPDLLASLEATGAEVARTDEDGDVVVVQDGDGEADGLLVRTRG